MHNIQDSVIICESEAMRQVMEKVSRVAPTSASVLILGESGVGKELVARKIHEISPRKHNRMYSLNCGAFSEALFESELFGYEKGAFTGANSTKPGKIELADGGSLFLDEIGDMPLPLQVKLLRVIQEGEFEHVGGNEPIRVDVRIISATNKDLKVWVATGKFRKDLFFRLSVVPILVPPLRERRDDISPMIDYFIAKFNKKHKLNIQGITQRYRGKLLQCNYPGNARQLENHIEKEVTLSKSSILDLGNSPEDQIIELDPVLHDEPGHSLSNKTVLEGLKAISLGGNGKPWYQSLRCVTIESIADFLVKQGNEWFSRKQFNGFLQTHSRWGRSGDKTAGVYLKILMRNDIVMHNGQKANKSRFRIATRFLNQT